MDEFEPLGFRDFCFFGSGFLMAIGLLQLFGYLPR